MNKRPSLARAGAALAVVLGLSALGVTQTAHADDTDTTLTTLYDVEGSSAIGSIDTDLQIGPTVLSETLDVPTKNIVAGTMPVPSQQVQFNAFGFMPIRATATLIQEGPITGTLRPGSAPRTNVITANVSYTIQLSNVQAQIFGFWKPMYVGNNCKTADPVEIEVATPEGETFNVFSGGPVEGTYTIGDFSGCNAFYFPGGGTFLVNSLVPGTDNTITLQLSNGRLP